MTELRIDYDVCSEWETPPQGWDDYLRHVVRVTFDQAQWTHGGYLSFVLTQDAEIQSLNHTYRSKDQTTNVLSFPSWEPEDLSTERLILGDVVLSLGTVLRECEEIPRNFWFHVTHLLVHGILHILGYDHVTEEDASVMEPLEVRILASLNYSSPYEIYV